MGRERKGFRLFPNIHVLFLMFFQAWELLVLTKLGWNLELVTACDYLPPLLSLLTERGGEEEEEEDAKSSLVTNGELVSIELVDIWSGGGNTERKVTVGGGGRGGDSFAALFVKRCESEKGLLSLFKHFGNDNCSSFLTL